MTRQEKDKRLGVLPLGQALCDDCSRLAVTRWYADHGTKRESVAYTVCEAHNFALLRRNKEERKRLGLDRAERSTGG
jgi:hypothetical protein